MTAEIILAGSVIALVIALVAAQLRESFPAARLIGWGLLSGASILLFGYELVKTFQSIGTGVVKLVARSGSSIAIDRASSPGLFWFCVLALLAICAFFLFASFAVLLEKVFGWRLRFGRSPEA